MGWFKNPWAKGGENYPEMSYPFAETIEPDQRGSSESINFKIFFKQGKSTIDKSSILKSLNQINSFLTGNDFVRIVCKSPIPDAILDSTQDGRDELILIAKTLVARADFMANLLGNGNTSSYPKSNWLNSLVRNSVTRSDLGI